MFLCLSSFFGLFHRITDKTPKRHRCQWEDKDMEATMKIVEEGKSVNDASRQFRVPRKILDKRPCGTLQ